MPAAFKKILKILIPITVGILFIWYQYSKLSEDQLTMVKNAFVQADYFWIVLSSFLMLVSHLSRAWRWRYMLEPLGFSIKFPISVSAIGLGYLLNLLIPRSGELARGVVAHRYEGVPVEKSIGTIISERLFDLIILMVLIALAFVLQYEKLSTWFISKNLDVSNLIFILAALALLGLAGLYFIFKSTHPFALKLRNFILGLKEGAMSIWTMKKKWSYLLHTFIIWGLYLLMFYLCFFALAETSETPIAGILAAFVIGSLAVAFTNGGFGAYPLFIAEILAIFGVDYAIGTAFGWIVWISQTILLVAYGGVSFWYLSTQNRLDNSQ